MTEKKNSSEGFCDTFWNLNTLQFQANKLIQVPTR